MIGVWDGVRYENIARAARVRAKCKDFSWLKQIH